MNPETYLKFHKQLELVWDKAIEDNDREMLMALHLHAKLAKEKGTSFEEEILRTWLASNDSH